MTSAVSTAIAVLNVMKRNTLSAEIVSLMEMKAE